MGSRHAAARGVRPGAAWRSSARSACARSTCNSRPGRSCTSAGWPNSPPAKARRSRRRCPTFLNALVGKGVHVTTVNDYLAQRDAEWIGPVYQKLGLTVGCLQQKMDDADRSRRVPPRRHLRHRRRVRLRLPARPAEGPRRPGRRRPRSGRRGCPARTPPSSTRASSARSTSPSWTRPTASSSTRPGRRSSSPTPRGSPRRRSRSSTSGPTASPGR